MLYGKPGRSTSRRIRRLKFKTGRGKFVAAGRVIEEITGVGIPGLTVRAFDLDRRYDDLAGVARTDELGFFRIEYNQSDFAASEHEPEMYIDILGGENRTLYASPRKPVKSGNVEIFNVDLDARLLPPVLIRQLNGTQGCPEGIKPVLKRRRREKLPGPHTRIMTDKRRRLITPKKQMRKI
jgi:hypothetical protein